jgi:hypothetical protein
MNTAKPGNLANDLFHNNQVVASFTGLDGYFWEKF